MSKDKCKADRRGSAIVEKCEKSDQYANYTKVTIHIPAKFSKKFKNDNPAFINITW